MEIQDCFQNVFDSPDGKEVLAHILNKCGYFATDPQYVSADLHAFANWLLASIGTLSPAGMGNYMECLIEAARRNNK